MVDVFASAAGSRTVSEDLAERLGTLGWTVETASSQRGRIRRATDMGFTAWRKRHTYDVASVAVYSGMAFAWAEMVCGVLHRAGKPYVLTLHGGNLPAFARRWPRRVRRLLASAAAVTAPSRYLLDAMREWRRELLLIPNALDIRAYPFAWRERASARMVWVRAFHDVYDPVMAVKVVSRLASDFDEASLIMVGPDKGDGSLKRTMSAAESLGVAGRIRFAGAVKKAEVSRFLGQADVFLNTSNVDNTPVTVLEAMACGLCVATTDVGGIPYLVEDGRNGLLVPAGDAGRMSAAVTRILAEPGLSGTLSAGARKKAEPFDWSAVLPQWDELLTDVLRLARK